MKKILVLLLVAAPLLAACSAAKNPENTVNNGSLNEDPVGEISENTAEIYPEETMSEEILPDMQVVGVPGSQEPVFCTMDAKICADGSFVGRSGPHCEFDPCPEDSIQE